MPYFAAALTIVGLVNPALAQNPPAARFEVASVKANTTTDPPTSRFPLGPGDAYLPGTLFAATNQPLINYIRFAFGRSQGELLRLPAWVYDERFDIQGRTLGDPRKEDMRLMVRTLLVDRFGLTWHLEPREEPVFELVVSKPGTLGPQLTRHGDDQPCARAAPLVPMQHLTRSHVAAPAWSRPAVLDDRASPGAENRSPGSPGCCPITGSPASTASSSITLA